MKVLEPYNEEERRMVCWAWWEHSSRCEEVCQEEKQMCSMWLQRVKLGRLLWRGWPLKAGRGKTEIMAGQVCLKSFLVSSSRTDQTLFLWSLPFYCPWEKSCNLDINHENFPNRKVKVFFFLNPDLNANLRKKDFLKNIVTIFFFLSVKWMLLVNFCKKLHAAMQSVSVKHFLGAYSLADTALGTACS